MKNNYSQYGFTLIELVVVIAIIGVLTAFAVPNFMAARERARDVQRKNDLKQLQNAIEMYKLDYGEYPPDEQTLPLYGLYDGMKTTNICWYSDGSNGLIFSSTVPLDKVIYMKKVPKEPLTADGVRNSLNGAYYYSRSDVYKYTLCTCLENKADSDGIVANCDGEPVAADSDYACIKGISYTLTEP